MYTCATSSVFRAWFAVNPARFAVIRQGMLPSDFTVRAFQARISVATARPMAPKKNAAANAALAAANALRKPQARCPQAPCGCAPDGSVEKGFMNKHHLALHLALRHELEPGTIRNLLYKDPAMITNMRLPRDTTASVTGDCRNMTIEDLEQLVELFPDTQACKCRHLQFVRGLFVSACASLTVCPALRCSLLEQEEQGRQPAASTAGVHRHHNGHQNGTCDELEA